MISDEVQIVPRGRVGCGSQGHFGTLVNGLSHWYNCREYFHSYADCLNLRDYFYKHHKRIESLDIFIGLVENHLKIEEKTVLSKTNFNEICHVHVSSWWIRSPMRHAFFTICLRAFLNWDENVTNWKETILNSKYGTKTKEAVNLFLDGHTNYVGNIPGWCWQFDGGTTSLATSQLKSFLLKPNEVNKVIKDKAYLLWEKEGKQENKSDYYWLKVEKDFVF